MASISSERKQEMINDINHEIMQEQGLNLDKVCHRKLIKEFMKQTIKEDSMTIKEMETCLRHRHDSDYAKLRLKRKLQAKQNITKK